MSLVLVLVAALTSAGATTVKRNPSLKRWSKPERGALRGGSGGLLQAQRLASADVDDVEPAAAPQVAAQLKKQYPYYHTSDELDGALEELAEDCEGADFKKKTVSDPKNSDVTIDVYTVKAKNSSPINRVFFLSGEHARELIGSETTLRLLQALCGADGGSVEQRSFASVANVLKDSEFMVVVNGNPKSRLKVEQGEYCVRENPAGVDLNRNWDEEWNEDMTLQTNPGDKPFSEPETRIVQLIVEKYKPTAFVSVHSGTLGMYMPWAWSPDKSAGRNKEAMMNVLRSLDATHCECPFGAAGKEVGYPCPGTSVDYVFDKLKTPYSFAFEIWGNPAENDHLKERWRAKMESGGESLLQMGASLSHAHFSEVFSNRTWHQSDFVITSEAARSAQNTEQSKEMCFYTFNPDNQESYSDAVDNWASAYLEMAAMIAKDLRAKKDR